MIKKPFLSILFLVVLQACSQTTEIPTENYVNIYVNAEKFSDCSRWESILEDIDFLPLETKESSLIDRIRSIHLSDNGNFLIKTKSRKVIVFSNVGKEIYSFNKMGKGFNEIPYVLDAQLTSNNNLYVFGSTKKHLLFDNNFRNVQEIFFSVQNIYTDTYSPTDWLIDDNKTLFQWYASGSFISKRDRYSLIIIDSIGNILIRKFPYNHYGGGGDHFFQSNRAVLIQPPLLNDTIFQITDQKIQEAFYIDFGKHKYKAGDYDAETSENINNPFHIMQFFSEKNVCNSIARPVMSENHLVFNFNFSAKLLTCIYNKSTKEAILIDCRESKIDNIFTPSLIYACHNNRFITAIDAWKVRQMLDEEKTFAPFLTDKKRLMLLDKLKHVKETDNPVLLLITLKN